MQASRLPPRRKCLLGVPGVLAGLFFTFGSAERQATAGETPTLPRASSSPAPAPVTGAAPDAARPPEPDDTNAVADPVVEVDASRTPISEREAARHLARAWESVFEAPPAEATLALLWAHWAHETRRGQRMHAYNFAGIKGKNPQGTRLLTREADEPSRRVVRTFRAYPSAEAGALDYVRLLSQRYPSALRAARAGNVERFVFALDQGGYFTDSDRAYLRALALLSDEFKKRADDPAGALLSERAP